MTISGKSELVAWMNLSPYTVETHRRNLLSETRPAQRRGPDSIRRTQARHFLARIEVILDTIHRYQIEFPNGWENLM